VDAEFCHFFRGCGYKLAIETNGSVELPHVADTYAAGADTSDFTVKRYLFDWITVSPKVAEHAVKQLWANEVKYVRGWGQAIPKPACKAEHYVISPAFDAMRCDPKTIQWCTRLCIENPEWRLSLQQHKLYGVR
jgi:organic radical activating enzyme